MIEIRPFQTSADVTEFSVDSLAIEITAFDDSSLLHDACTGQTIPEPSAALLSLLALAGLTLRRRRRDA